MGNVESYSIYKKVEGCDEVLARIEPQAIDEKRQTWTDFSVIKPKRTDPMFKIDYRIRTRTMEGIFSNYSERKSIYGNTRIWKKSVAKEEEYNISSYQLYQNTPNPFNPSTTIRFVIPNEVRNLKNFLSQAPRNDNVFVNLKVYDVLGREVATLVNEQKPVGNYEVKFDVSELSSGIFSIA